MIYRREKWDDKENANKKITSDLERNRRRKIKNESDELGRNINVRYHCGGWSEEVNSCILISYMVYL